MLNHSKRIVLSDDPCKKPDKIKYEISYTNITR